ncbi:uncharacterized protein ANIA_10663 [Aspergillus nidulans FGSC A4]|uniref:Phosphoglycerate mutase family protein n=1 Tax=Emericella nidulans (strain FGSC A4 / ATCC 38163 / CBS 112.46 / NRRL 194 / M139) TaxID=227321 RepID=C8VGU1_EMENI|nr:hypothetical protein [Aspergillus nidulans FGSC A4]CBF82080.1 TPA: conserved hypothetical protein [Aspergillus nidulans FGSC A4]
MGKPPAAIFIVRHGARLDAANKEWHLTSPTPYDPPLSYGGWLQSRALGARIINEVRALEDQLDRPAQGDHDPIAHSHRLRERKQKRRIIIHTSPFLRCVQTAIAISSGISQNHNDIESLRQSRVASSQSNGIPASDSATSPEPETPQGSSRCLLRVDACLGEWLNTEYFENIAPPPKSERMVANAKTELLRRDESVIPIADTQPTPTVGHFPGGWGSPVSAPDEEDRKFEVESSSATTNGPAQRNRSGSYDSFRAVDTPWGRKILKINTDVSSNPGAAYAPPVPSYAISPSNPIPDGYVTHARDNCVLVDYQWDSMREPQNWGSGGEYGDEWSTMLTRFRSGINRIISWYQDDDASAPLGHRRTRSQLQFLGQNEAEESAVDTILILVTHGAGCNALIGALSGEPALVNVPTASLTLAVRKDYVKDLTRNGERAKKYDLLSRTSGPEHYNLVEVASTDHLRPGTSPITTSARSPTSLRSPSTSSIPTSPISSYRHRSTISSGPIIMGQSLKAGMGLQSWTTSRPSSGLWKSVSRDRDTVDDLVPNFGSPLSATSSSSISGMDGASEISSPTSGDSACSGQIPQRTLSQRGLWRSGPLNKERSAHTGRRWTVAERPH